MNRIRCPLCRNLSCKTVYKNKNTYFANSNAKFALEIKICRTCDFVFQSSAYTDKYNNTFKKVYKDFRKSEFFDFPNRSAQNLEALNIILTHMPKKKNLNILEIGSNRGDLLQMIKENVPYANILGVEPTGFTNLGVPTIKSFFKKGLFSNKFDVVILQHVLEHITYPRVMLSDIAEILSEEGNLYIEVPYLNNSIKYGLDDFSPEHVNYFNLKSLSDSLKTLGIAYYKVEAFLKVIAKKKTGACKFNDSINLKDAFDSFKKKRETMIARIKRMSAEGKKILFYGVSYYFRSLLNEMIPKLDIKNCYYYDDNYTKPYEEIFGLSRLEKFDKNCAIIICSTNFLVQEKILEKLSGHKGITIIRPWFKIYEN